MAWIRAGMLNRRARAYEREAQDMLNASAANRYAIEVSENRAKDQRRVVAQLSAEANENRWRMAVMGGQK
jgi:hypothetical protein